jgi:hypothetical protein
MAWWGEVVAGGRRALAIVGLVVAGVSVVVFLELAPNLYGLLPLWLRRHRLALILLGLAAAYALVRLLAARRWSVRNAAQWLRWVVDPMEDFANLALAGGLSVLVGAVCLVFLATWAPHYVLWPWYRDTDTFATLAQSWDAGILPYRDIRGYNFPGAIYLFWVLGKLAGWGRTWAFYALDAAALAFLGVALTAWSRRCLGAALPGLGAYLIFVEFYLSLDFEIVAQRDWHASLCAVLALLFLEAWPGRASRCISAALAAAALATRPHVVVFLPVVAAAVVEGSDRPGAEPSSGHSGSRSIRPLGEWSVALGAFTLLFFAPLLFAGIADDLVRSLRIVAIGGPYNHTTLPDMARVLADELRQPRTQIIGGLLCLTLAWSRGALRRRAVIWTLALAAALCYRVVHPVQHRYLVYPEVLVGSVALALPMAWIITRPGITSVFRLSAMLLLLYEMSHAFPAYCSVTDSLRAIRSLARGETLPAATPPGSSGWFDEQNARWYNWDDYRRVLTYIRETTGAASLVANVLRHPPYPAINGPAGRLSPFRAESGICWMLLVDLDLEAEFTASLERATDSVVIWAPSEHDVHPRLRLAELAAAIRRHYRFDARFGHIEVWRRATGPPDKEFPGRDSAVIMNPARAPETGLKSPASRRPRGGRDSHG